MARPWSARCYGVARQREGSRQNSIGGHPVHRSRTPSGEHVARTMRGHFLWQLGKRRINFREQRRCLEGFGNFAR
jgi:hypothetical protein